MQDVKQIEEIRVGDKIEETSTGKHYWTIVKEIHYDPAYDVYCYYGDWSDGESGYWTSENVRKIG